MEVEPTVVIGSLFAAYMIGWGAGFLILTFKQLMEKI